MNIAALLAILSSPATLWLAAIVVGALVVTYYLED